MFRITALVTGLLLLLVPARVTYACSCSRGSVTREFVPPLDATDFPVDGRIRVFIWGGLSIAMLDGLAREYRVLDAKGRQVELHAELHPPRIDLIPVAPLTPNARYTVEQVFAYSADGERLSDAERWQAATPKYPSRRGGPPTPPRVAPPSKRRWAPIGTIHTGSGASADAARGPPETSKASSGVSYGGGDCGPGAGVYAEYDLPGHIRPSDLLGLEIEGLGIVHTQPVKRALKGRRRARASIGAGTSMCNPDSIYIESSDRLRARVVLVTASERVVRPQGWRVASASRPIRRGRVRKANFEDRLGRSLDAEAGARARASGSIGFYSRPQPERFFGAPLSSDAVPQVRARGPAACPFGLERTGRLELGPGNLPWGDQEISVGQRGGRVQALLLNAPAGRGVVVDFGFDGEGPRRRNLPGRADAAVAVFADDATYAAIKGYRGEHVSVLEVLRLDRDNDTVWKTQVSGEGVHLSPRIVLRDGAVAVSWDEVGPSSPRGVGRWAVLDAASGERRGSKSGAQASLDGPTISLVQTPRGVELSWLTFTTRASPRVGTLRLADGMLLDAREQTRAADSTRWVDGVRVLLNGRRAQVQFPGGKPIEVGRGTGAPRSFQAALFEGVLYVAWTSSEGAFITAVDAQGRVAPPVEIDEQVHDPHVVAFEGTIAVVYNHAFVNSALQARAAWFVCRTTAPSGPPTEWTP